MKKLSLFLICILLMSCDSSSTKKVFPYEIHKKILSNELTVIAIPFDSPGLVTFSTVVRVGSRNEVDKGLTGFAHFFEHLMFYGSKKRGKSAADKIKKSIAAGGSAYTSDDQTIYYLTGNSKKLETFFDLNSDNFKNLYFDKPSFKREAGAVLGEYTKNFSGWYRQINSKLREIAFQDHTYSHTPMGLEEDIKNMPNQYEYAWTFFSRFYRPENCAIVVVGDIQPENVFNLAEKYYSDWREGDFIPEIKKEREQTEERIGHITRGDVLPVVMMGYRNVGYTENQKESICLEVISDILGSNKSELYQRLVNKEQKAKSFWTWNPTKRDPLYYTVIFRTDKKKQQDLIYLKEEFEKEIEKVKYTPQNEKFLSDIKSNKKYRFLSSLNNPQSIALEIAETFQVSGEAENINTYFDILDQITAEDIMKTAKKYLVNSRRTIVTMTEDEKGLF